MYRYATARLTAVQLPPGALSHDDEEEDDDNDEDYIITLNDDGNTALNVS